MLNWTILWDYIRLIERNQLSMNNPTGPAQLYSLTENTKGTDQPVRKNWKVINLAGYKCTHNNAKKNKLQKHSHYLL